MAIELKMPALSPTMEEGTLAKWLVKEGDQVKSGDLLAEIETDKATMEFEAIDEGTVAKLVVAAGTDGVKVGQVIAIITEEGEVASEATSSASEQPAAANKEAEVTKTVADEIVETEAKQEVTEQAARTGSGDENPPSGSAAKPASDVQDGKVRVRVSPLARRMAEQQGLDLSSVTGSGPNGRIVKADLQGAKAAAPGAQPAPQPVPPEPAQAAAPTKSPATAPAAQPGEVPHEAVKLSGMRKVIARRLTESKQQVPHIYLTVDINLDRLLKLRTDLNTGLESRGVKLSVNDMLIKALAVALEANPKCNVSYAGDQMLMYSRADISVAVSVPAGLITPIIVDAGGKSLSKIATEMKVLADRAKAGKLAPHEYQGGTASLSNMGMFGIKNFDAVINPPQGMIMAIGAGEKRPYVVDGALAIATVMSATGSFDHRAIDGADGAALMKTFKELVENPLGMLA